MAEERRYTARKATGLCVGCGHVKPRAKRVRCRECLAAVAAATAARARALIKRDTCRTCGQRQAKPGHRDCAPCLRRYARYTAARTRNRRKHSGSTAVHD